MSIEKDNYAKWSDEQLRRAESVAGRFLAENGVRISESFRTKIEALDQLVKSLRNRRMPVEERLDCFARIAEISRALGADAESFFGLASEPVVARILANVAQKPDR
jgi:hypothetical protein